jgi:hypothetical protein
LEESSGSRIRTASDDDHDGSLPLLQIKLPLLNRIASGLFLARLMSVAAIIICQPLTPPVLAYAPKNVLN